METMYLHHQNKLYRYILSAEFEKDPDRFLSMMLELLIKAAGVSKGYIEINFYDCQKFWASDRFGEKEIKKIRRVISTGIISRVIETEDVIQTCSAICDPRFSSRQSVQRAKVEAVVCMPIITGTCKGIIYLQGGESFKAESKEIIDELKLIIKKMIPAIDLLYRRRLNCEKTGISSLRKKYSIKSVIGKSKSLENFLKKTLMVAPLDINIMITGETGTGKSQIAEVIHKNSLRKGKPFVELNCAALPENLIENELFGSVQGGHSSAVKPVTGKVGAAEGGTLFLDEIGELSIQVQAKLLHFIQSGIYYPLGASKPVKSDLRIITATNIDLKKAIINKKFREDLYFRINVFPIEIPALSDRKLDIPELALYFCRECCEKHGFDDITISKPCEKILIGRKWKGNIRELKHTVENAVINAILEGEKKIFPKHLKDEHDNNEIRFSIENFKSATMQFQKDYIKSNLEVRNWNVSKTAKDIDISRSQLNNLIKSFRLSRYENGDFKGFF